MDRKSLQLDGKDKAIINALVRNSRKSSRDISNELGMAHPTVLARIKALEAAGVIQGYTASISLKKVGYPVKMMFLVGAGRLSGDDVERVQRYIEKEPSFLHAGTVCGDNDLFVFGHFADHEEAVEKASAFRNFLSKNMDLRSFRSYNVWRTIKFRNALELR